MTQFTVPGDTVIERGDSEDFITPFYGHNPKAKLASFSNFFHVEDGIRITCGDLFAGVNFHHGTLMYAADTVFEAPTSEQLFMLGKAIIFGDMKTAVQLQEPLKPGTAKKIGRGVKKFDVHVWSQHGAQIMKNACRAKFFQCERFKNELLKSTGTLCEAAKGDRIWGVGLGLNDPAVFDRQEWKGKNKLGFLLTELREEVAGLETVYSGKGNSRK